MVRQTCDYKPVVIVAGNGDSPDCRESLNPTISHWQLEHALRQIAPGQRLPPRTGALIEWYKVIAMLNAHCPVPVIVYQWKWAVGDGFDSGSTHKTGKYKHRTSRPG